MAGAIFFELFLQKELTHLEGSSIIETVGQGITQGGQGNDKDENFQDGRC
jgi:hypothetical protein